ncbi:MAG TPA: hypothetical protein PKX50_07325, partial [Thermomonas sp.]|nr:hypothetical protein [Thermomonas sp.]
MRAKQRALRLHRGLPRSGEDARAACAQLTALRAYSAAVMRHASEHHDMHTVFATHLVDNQPPPFGTHNLWDDDAALREAVLREAGEAFSIRLAEYGALAGGR